MSVERLRRAWLDEGSHPTYHREKKEQLRQEWPVLYSAIEELLEENKRPAINLNMFTPPAQPVVTQRMSEEDLQREARRRGWI